MIYDHQKLDSKWQDQWEKEEAFKAIDFSPKPKYYALDMFPYPSGAGLHVGHMASYTPTDVISRYKRQKGFNVLHPIGYDAFGLPAEQYAIQTGVPPEETTKKAIENFRRQLKSFGMSFDWSREVSTCFPNFYKWTQFIFTVLHEKGLAYQKEAPVNWCPALKTVLANEEVVDGKSERGGHPVVRKPMKQWMLQITDYADKLLEGLEDIDWPDRTKEGQKNWIGKSTGAHVDFSITGTELNLKVFTTRPDTLFGATFMVISPEHPYVETITTTEQKEAVTQYCEEASRKSEIDRKAATDKTGVFTGATAVNPLTDKEIPIWISDYVLMDYGTGAIMAVPAHDERDFEFATKFELPIERVVQSEGDLPFEGSGLLMNSGFLDGLSKEDAIPKAIEHLEQKNLGEKTFQYKLRDWLFSRQRYWGEPFPVVTGKDGTNKTLPVEELPVTLPQVTNYEPSDDGQAPLSTCEEWVNYGAGYKRETDTMPGSAGSSWYFLRYTDPTNENSFADIEKQKYWMPVDLYVGGPEHTVGHLLYSRFWQRVLFEKGLASCPEPFKKLAHQGMILGPDGEKMSKSRGNVVNPDDVKAEYGADALRCFILFLGPMERDKPWSPSGITGTKKFLDRVWRLCIDENGQPLGEDKKDAEELQRLTHKTIKKVGEDIESLGFNTAISALMILVNEAYKQDTHSKEFLKTLVSLLAPFAPHMCEEIWQKMNHEGLASLSAWPEYDTNLITDDTVTIGVQVNGKKRGAIDVAKDASQEDALKHANDITAVTAAIDNKPIRKVIYVPGKILNIIAK